MRAIASLLLLVTGISACGGATPGDLEAGRDIYRSSQCVQCHGNLREGTEFAPPLKGLAENWSETDLMEYFLDPSVWVKKTPRLQAFYEKYSMVMPRFRFEENARRDLTRYLLGAEE